MFGFCLSWENLLEISRRGGCLLIIGSQVRALVRPPSSLCKPHVSGTALNRAFLRGFPATHFPDFGLCRRSRILAAIFGALSLHPKIPFPAAGIEPEVRPQIATRNSDFWGTAVWDFGLAPKLSPNDSNCRPHSVGGSRSRSIPMPRGRRPSTSNARCLRRPARALSDAIRTAQA